MSFLLRFGKPRTFIQVGAFTGDDELIDACRRFGHHLYMFEPNPKRAAELERKSAAAPTIRVIPKAVSNYNGSATFHIACYDDCSSLQNFDDAANTAWVHQWHPYKHFEMVDDIEVEVIRLETFLDRNCIAQVDRLEIDAQGEDLRVVESLGARVADVKKIQIEVNIHDSPLYRDSFTKEQAVAFFTSHGFERHISWKQSMNREENIVFRNRAFYRYPPINAVVAAFEQNWMSLRIAWVKLPRVLAVTKTMLRQKLSGERS
jgi:FkbM family methyltransferase